MAGDDDFVQSGLARDIGEAGVEREPGGLAARRGLDAAGSHSLGLLPGQGRCQQAEEITACDAHGRLSKLQDRLVSL